MWEFRTKEAISVDEYGVFILDLVTIFLQYNRINYFISTLAKWKKTITIEDTDVIPTTTETLSDDNDINCNTSISIKENVISATDHIKNIRHKRDDVDKCVLMCTLSDFIVENTISNKKCSNGLDSYNRINQTVG